MADDRSARPRENFALPHTSSRGHQSIQIQIRASVGPFAVAAARIAHSYLRHLLQKIDCLASCLLRCSLSQRQIDNLVCRSFALRAKTRAIPEGFGISLPRVQRMIEPIAYFDPPTSRLSKDFVLIVHADWITQEHGIGIF